MQNYRLRPGGKGGDRRSIHTHKPNEKTHNRAAQILQIDGEIGEKKTEDYM
jgi:hypothetical protein